MLRIAAISKTLRFLTAGIFLFTFKICAADVSSNSTITVSPPANWVTPHFFERLPDTFEAEAGDDERWLLAERQINAGENETFYHNVRQILSIDGVQNGANISIDFNPAYQSLAFHWIRIWRGTNFFDRLDLKKVKVIEPERGLDDFVFAGDQTAMLVLDDVRVGDIIDCAYSIRGVNPVFGGKFCDGMPTQFAEPVNHLILRLLWPAQRTLFAKYHGKMLVPLAVQSTNDVEYLWDEKNLSALHVEDSLPGWFDPQPWIQLSEFPTWGAVNQWALQLFQNSSPLSPELLQKISEWRQLATDDQKVLAALRFVQEEIRYFGIEIGKNSHQPSNPSDVFARRYGDCKDKSLLFVTILRALNIEAFPVLVNSELGRGIEQWQPSPLAFDHVIAQVQLDSQIYWLDPTATYQRGPLSGFPPVDFERGLVVCPGTTALTVIPRDTDPPPVQVTETFRLGGRTEPAQLKIVTVADGAAADDLRAELATTKREDAEQSYLHFYSGIYPGIEQSQPLAVEDDERRNQIVTTENYLIKNFWTHSDNHSPYECDFFPLEISDFFKKPVDQNRAMPLSVPFPAHKNLKIEVMLPIGAAVRGENKTVSDPAFFYQMKLKNFGTRLEMDYEYQSLADSVSADDVPDYLNHLDQASRSLDFGLIWR
jgi:hypothetical protein